jgi:alpha-L-rhamnosidase
MSLRSRLACLLAAALLLTPLLPATAAPPRPSEACPKVLNLKTNNLTNPLGIAAGAPRLSWQLDGTRRGTTQTRYEIHVASTAARRSARTSGTAAPSSRTARSTSRTADPR